MMPYEITVQDLAARIREGKPLLLVDVREDWEREIGALPGSIHIPMAEVGSRISEFKAPAAGEIVIYCHHGIRSLMAAEYLEQNGVPSVGSLEGGIEFWSEFIDPSVPRY
jgi:rhodanese-related sulfurtransferase